MQTGVHQKKNHCFVLLRSLLLLLFLPVNQPAWNPHQLSAFLRQLSVKKSPHCRIPVKLPGLKFLLKSGLKPPLQMTNLRQSPLTFLLSVP